MTVFIGAIIILIIVLVSYSTTLVSRISSSIRLQQDLAPVKNQFRWVKSGLISIAFLLISLIAFTIWQYWQKASLQENTLKENILHAYDSTKVWNAPDLSFMLQSPDKELLVYGRQLIANTADFLGPAGIIRPISNGMNCQNCHLDAGTKAWGNNYSGVAANYPKLRARSGTVENITKRINDCFQRSLNGDTLKPDSKEMKAMAAYIQWLGQAVPKNQAPKGVGLKKLAVMTRAADPVKGHELFISKCQSCHGADGQGLPKPEDPSTKYPPLWGDHSYNEAAGLYRVSTFAGYIKTNMPFGATADNPQLSDEEAWDLAAFVNGQPRPKHKFLATDWPQINKKPYDHPFGPYEDTFTEAQHKYGPYQPIIDFQKQTK